MNFTHRIAAADEALTRHEEQLGQLEQLAIRADSLWAQTTALACLLDVLIARCALTSPAWEADLDDIALSAGYQLRSMALAGLAPDRREMIREAAQSCVDAKMAELRAMFEVRDRLDAAKPGDWDFPSLDGDC